MKSEGTFFRKTKNNLLMFKVCIKTMWKKSRRKAVSQYIFSIGFSFFYLVTVWAIEVWKIGKILNKLWRKSIEDHICNIIHNICPHNEQFSFVWDLNGCKMDKDQILITKNHIRIFLKVVLLYEMVLLKFKLWYIIFNSMIQYNLLIYMSTIKHTKQTYNSMHI